MLPDYETRGQYVPAGSQDKLILPPAPDMPYHPSGHLEHTQMIRPEQLIYSKTPPPPRKPVAKLRYFWHKDPAYKVLMIAVVMVLIASIVMASLVANALIQGMTSTPPQGNPPQAAGLVVPTGTVDTAPKFGTPGGGKGSKSSSQPPAVPTPTLSAPTPTVAPTQPTGTLTVQITSIPNRVKNNRTVNVGVTVSQPNVAVALFIVYNMSPFRATAGPVFADGNGNATIKWNVAVFGFSNKATATVYAIAQDQNGNQVRSTPAMVQISVIPVGF